MKFKFINKWLYFEDLSILVLADLHIGYEEYLNSSGVLIPRVQFKEIMGDLEGVFKEIGGGNKKINEIVILGDLKHEFGTISSQEWREVKEVLDFLKKQSKKVVLVKGNHDTILGPIAKRKELKIVDFYIKEGVCFIHGNKLFVECLDKKVKMIVLGHRHPAIVLKDDYKREKYKCFLVGLWKKKKIIIMPSFFPLIEGSDVVDGSCNMLFIKDKNLKNFDVFVVGDKVYTFGKLKGLV